METTLTAVYLSVVIGIILGFGALGGAVNYHLTKEDVPGNSTLTKSLLLGVAASFLVPLFLEMIQSDLLVKGSGVTLNDRLALFPFAGFCLIAAISSKAFVSSLSKRILSEVEAAKDQAQEARFAAETAKSQAQEAQVEAETTRGAALSAEKKLVFTLVRSDRRSSEEERLTGMTPDTILENLIRKYNEIRNTQKPGRIRTIAMTRVVQEMIDLIPQLKNFPLLEYLHDWELNGGKRLAGYAYLYVNQNITYLKELVNTVTSIESKPFGQYWGIQAIDRVIGNHIKDEIDPEVLHSLRRFLSNLKRGTDRHYEISRILERLDNHDLDDGE